MNIIKFSLYNMPSEELLINGYFEKIGYKDSFWTIKVNGEKIRKGKGIAFSVPLSSVIGINMYQFLSNNKQGRED